MLVVGGVGVGVDPLLVYIVYQLMKHVGSRLQL